MRADRRLLWAAVVALGLFFVLPAPAGAAKGKVKAERARVAKSRVDKPKVDKPKVDKPKVDKPRVDEPKVEKPKVEKPKVEKSTRDKPAVEKAEAEVVQAPARRTKKATKGRTPRAARPPKVAEPKRRIARGTMTLRNVNTRDKISGLRVLDSGKKGKRDVVRLSPKGKKKLAWFLRDPRGGRVRQPPDRLLYQLYQAQQHFDAPMEIISGFRPKARRTSRHFKGWAVDFRIEGVETRTLWTFCKGFKDVGCGYYPTSGFVHMDIRDKSYSWVDVSGPGEPAQYVKHGEKTKVPTEPTPLAGKLTPVGKEKPAAPAGALELDEGGEGAEAEGEPDE